MAEQQQQMPMLKISMLHHRDRSKDEETWMKWYLEEQIPRFIAVVHKHGIERCELYLTPDPFKEKFQADLDTFKGGRDAGWKMASYDAATIYWVSDPQKLRNLVSDPEYQKIIEFEKGWIDQNRVDVQAGTQYTFIENGSIVNTVTKAYD